MKVAFLIIAHNRPDHLCKLIRNLYHQKCDFFIYIDGKSDIGLFQDALKEFNNCFFVDNRKKIYWGSSSLSGAIIELLKVSIKKDRYDRFQLLSGYDYPIKTYEKICEFYEQNTSNYISTWEIVRKESSDKSHKLFKYHFNDYPFLNKRDGQRLTNITKKLIVIFWSNCFKFIAKYFLPNRKLPFDLFKGSTWFSVNEAFVKSFLSWLETAEGKDMLEFIKFAPCSDEFLINTFGNMCFKHDIAEIIEKNVHALHYVEFRHGQGGPKNLRRIDFDDLIKSSALFARKFDRGSEELIKKLDLIINK